jgi:hypothetical protein
MASPELSEDKTEKPRISRTIISFFILLGIAICLLISIPSFKKEGFNIRNSLTALFLGVGPILAGTYFLLTHNKIRNLSLTNYHNLNLFEKIIVTLLAITSPVVLFLVYLFLSLPVQIKILPAIFQGVLDTILLMYSILLMAPEFMKGRFPRIKSHTFLHFIAGAILLSFYVCFKLIFVMNNRDTIIWGLLRSWLNKPFY